MESITSSDFSGSYTLKSQRAILTLILSQDAQRKISGTLSSARGMQFQFKDGREVVVEYQVHIEKGKTYWREYWFNGELYGKQ